MAKYRMTAEQAFKKRFAERLLGPMLAEATKGLVKGLEYGARRDDEWVEVAYSLPPWTQRVDVSCDSKWAIAKDVMRAVAKRYE